MKPLPCHFKFANHLKANYGEVVAQRYLRLVSHKDYSSKKTTGTLYLGSLAKILQILCPKCNSNDHVNLSCKRKKFLHWRCKKCDLYFKTKITET